MKKAVIIIILLFNFFTSCNEDNSPINVPQPVGAVLDIPLGGPTEPNQVWVDLDLNTLKVNQRDIWDFGFYSGDEYRVILNTSILMAAGKLNTTDIDKVTEADVIAMKSVVAVGTFQADNVQYVDDIKGNYLERTAIDEISANDEDNKVYLINMGYWVYKDATTELTTVGERRGWKKIRVLRDGNNGYKIQYADISDTTHQEITVSKNSNYLFTFLSLSNGVVDVQPPKDLWDMCFTIFVNENTGAGTYTFSDFVTINTMNGTGAYKVMISDVGSYEDFTKEKVDYSKFIYNDQRVIGSSWRKVAGGGAKVYTDLFYILKDNLGTLYKIRFLSMTNNEGHRGYPQFEYKVLNE